MIFRWLLSLEDFSLAFPDAFLVYHLLLYGFCDELPPDLNVLPDAMVL